MIRKFFIVFLILFLVNSVSALDVFCPETTSSDWVNFTSNCEYISADKTLNCVADNISGIALSVYPTSAGFSSCVDSLYITFQNSNNTVVIYGQNYSLDNFKVNTLHSGVFNSNLKFLEQGNIEGNVNIKDFNVDSRAYFIVNSDVNVDVERLDIKGSGVDLNLRSINNIKITNPSTYIGSANIKIRADFENEVNIDIEGKSGADVIEFHKKGFDLFEDVQNCAALNPNDIDAIDACIYAQLFINVGIIDVSNAQIISFPLKINENSSFLKSNISSLLIILNSELVFDNSFFNVPIFDFESANAKLKLQNIDYPSASPKYVNLSLNSGLSQKANLFEIENVNYPFVFNAIVGGNLTFDNLINVKDSSLLTFDFLNYTLFNDIQNNSSFKFFNIENSEGLQIKNFWFKDAEKISQDNIFINILNSQDISLNNIKYGTIDGDFVSSKKGTIFNLQDSESITIFNSIFNNAEIGINSIKGRNIIAYSNSFSHNKVGVFAEGAGSEGPEGAFDITLFNNFFHDNQKHLDKKFTSLNIILDIEGSGPNDFSIGENPECDSQDVLIDGPSFPLSNIPAAYLEDNLIKITPLTPLCYGGNLYTETLAYGGCTTNCLEDGSDGDNVAISGYLLLPNVEDYAPLVMDLTRTNFDINLGSNEFDDYFDDYFNLVDSSLEDRFEFDEAYFGVRQNGICVFDSDINSLISEKQYKLAPGIYSVCSSLKYLEYGDIDKDLYFFRDFIINVRAPKFVFDVDFFPNSQEINIIKQGIDNVGDKNLKLFSKNSNIKMNIENVDSELSLYLDYETIEIINVLEFKDYEFVLGDALDFKDIVFTDLENSNSLEVDIVVELLPFPILVELNKPTENLNGNRYCMVPNPDYLDTDSNWERKFELEFAFPPIASGNVFYSAFLNNFGSTNVLNAAYDSYPDNLITLDPSGTDGYVSKLTKLELATKYIQLNFGKNNYVINVYDDERTPIHQAIFEINYYPEPPIIEAYGGNSGLSVDSEYLCNDSAVDYTIAGTNVSELVIEKTDGVYQFEGSAKYLKFDDENFNELTFGMFSCNRGQSVSGAFDIYNNCDILIPTVVDFTYNASQKQYHFTYDWDFTKGIPSENILEGDYDFYILNFVPAAITQEGVMDLVSNYLKIPVKIIPPTEKEINIKFVADKPSGAYTLGSDDSLDVDIVVTNNSLVPVTITALNYGFHKIGALYSETIGNGDVVPANGGTKTYSLNKELIDYEVQGIGNYSIVASLVAGESSDNATFRFNVTEVRVGTPDLNWFVLSILISFVIVTYLVTKGGDQQ
jgi:hypothetical protein